MSFPANSNATNNFGVAIFIVDPTPGLGTHTTITNALVSAAALGGNGNIFIRPATYTENVTLVTGWNLTGFTDDGLTPLATINGTITYNGTGTVSLAGLRLKTNGANFLSIGGSGGLTVNIDNCYLNSSNFTGLVYSTSNANSSVNINNCKGDSGSAGNFLIFGNFTTGQLNIRNSFFTNSSNNTTAGIGSATGALFIENTTSLAPISTTTTASLFLNACRIDTSVAGAVAIQPASGTIIILNSYISSGSHNAINTSGTTFISNCTINTTNAAAIVGSGNVSISGAVFIGTGVGITATTKHGLINKLGAPAYHYVGTAISYAVLVTDGIIGVTSTSAPRTITMPSTGMAVGQRWTVKDESGGAASNNITISGNGANIDGASTFVMNTNYGSVDIYWNGTAFFVI